eukprot:scaffold63172_cov27-Tisochrysis_lutea.AAC.7
MATCDVCTARVAGDDHTAWVPDRTKRMASSCASKLPTASAAPPLESAIVTAARMAPPSLRACANPLREMG